MHYYRFKTADGCAHYSATNLVRFRRFENGDVYAVFPGAGEILVVGKIEVQVRTHTSPISFLP